MCPLAGGLIGTKMECISLRPAKQSASILVLLMRGNTHARPPEVKQHQQRSVRKYHKMFLVGKNVILSIVFTVRKGIVCCNYEAFNHLLQCICKLSAVPGGVSERF